MLKSLNLNSDLDHCLLTHGPGVRARSGEFFSG